MEPVKDPAASQLTAFDGPRKYTRVVAAQISRCAAPVAIDDVANAHAN